MCLFVYPYLCVCSDIKSPDSLEVCRRYMENNTIIELNIKLYCNSTKPSSFTAAKLMSEETTLLIVLLSKAQM